MYNYEKDVNPELLKQVKEKENFTLSMLSKVCKCPKCKDGYFRHEITDREYSFDNWFECDKCNYVANNYRDKMIRDLQPDPYFDMDLWATIEQYEYNNVGNFNPQDFNALHKIKYRIDENGKPYERVLIWEDIVNETYQNYLNELNHKIENAKQYKLLKKFFKEN